jgi:lipopolysaccharide export system protein LptC
MQKCGQLARRSLVFAHAQGPDAESLFRAVVARVPAVTELARVPPAKARRQLNSTGPRLGRVGTAAGDAPAEHALWRSRRVAYLKLMLPAIALLIVTLILAWPQIVRDDNRVRFGGGRISAEEAETLRMVNARYVGVDDQQRPYVVTSVLATRDSAHAPSTDLKTPKADMTTASGAWVAVTAETGVYHNDAKLLDLAGDVSVFHDGGTEFHTATARVDLSAGSAAGDDPVDGQGPTGTVTSDGFRLYDRGARIVFTGKAHMLLFHPGALQ